jgi:hypothetical protein
MITSMRTPKLSTVELSSALGIDRSASPLVALERASLTHLAHDALGSPEIREVTPARWDDPTFWIPEAEACERSQYFAVGNAINFRFWNLRAGEIVPTGGPLRGEPFTGAMYMWRCLRLAWEADEIPFLDAPFLASMSLPEFDRLFADDNGNNPLRNAAEDRLTNLRNLGRGLNESWGGHFYKLVEATSGSLLLFTKYSASFRAFDDPIYKLTMVNAILHSGSGTAEFDAHPLPGIDYHLLKQLLRQGALRPRPALLLKLKQTQILSAEESGELRRVALNALLELSEMTEIPGEILDNTYWLNRQKCVTESPVCLDPSRAVECPFYGACAQLVDIGMPLELTRYY